MNVIYFLVATTVLRSSIGNPNQYLTTFIRNQAVQLPRWILSKNYENVGDILYDNFPVIRVEKKPSCYETTILNSPYLSNNLHYENINRILELTKTLLNEPIIEPQFRNDIRQKENCERKIELVDWLTSECESLLSLDRSLIHKYNLLHKGIGTLVVNSKSQIFVHQRASNKRIFPSMWDMFIGGISSSKEKSITTLLRELNEELGIDLLGSKNPTKITPWNYKNQYSYSTFTKDFKRVFQIKETTNKLRRSKTDPTYTKIFGDNIVKYLGRTTVETSYNHCLVDCYVTFITADMEENLHFHDGEVQSGVWMSMKELYDFVAVDREKFVPDGLQVWDDLFSML